MAVMLCTTFLLLLYDGYERSASSRQIDEWIRATPISPSDQDAPERLAVVQDAPLSGLWRAGRVPIWLKIEQSGPEKFSVVGHFYRGSPQSIAERSAVRRNGVLTLDAPLGDPHGKKIYTRIYAFQVEGQTVLIPSVYLREFEENPKELLEGSRRLVYVRVPDNDMERPAQ